MFIECIYGNSNFSKGNNKYFAVNIQYTAISAVSLMITYSDDSRV